MDLLTFIADPGRKAALAARTGASPAYLWQIATGWTPKGGKPKRASIDLAIAIERESTDIGPEGVPWRSLLPEVWVAMEQLGSVPSAANDDTHTTAPAEGGPAPTPAQQQENS